MIAKQHKLLFLAPKLALFLLWAAFCLSLHAQTISGTVSDPSGALVPGVRIEITGGDLA